MANRALRSIVLLAALALPATAAQPRENANTATASTAFDANLVARTALPTAPAPAANAIDLPGHPAVTRERASDLAPDSDLGDRMVVTGVAPLCDRQIAQALDAGEAVAQDYLDRGLILSACLAVQCARRIVGGAIAPVAGLTAQKTKDLTDA